MKPWLRLTLITLMVGGGFTGVAGNLQGLMMHRGQGSAGIALIVVVTALYAFVLVSGLLLVYRPEVTLPVIFALAPQVVWFSVWGIGYYFFTGLNLGVGLKPGRIATTVSLGSGWAVRWEQPGAWFIQVNLVPVVLLVAVVWTRWRAALPAPVEEASVEGPVGSLQDPHDLTADGGNGSGNGHP